MPLPPRVLNVGGGTSRDLPPHYKGWEQVLLDIDPNVKPDVVCDAKEMRKLPPAKYDAVFCSHNLEHFYRHEVPAVLAGFLHVLKPDGFVQIAVPDMMELFERVVRDCRDIDETWYSSSGGPISFHDVIYGWGKAVAQGNLYYAHKTGFSDKTLTKALSSAGFRHVMTAREQGNLHAYAFKSKAKPTPARLKTLGVL
jgi:SAM-dependent methyltransferase